MTWMKIAVVILVIALFAESSILASLYLNPNSSATIPTQAVRVLKNSYSATFDLFNQPQANDSEYSLNETLDGSWAITIGGQLVASTHNQKGSEAQIALAPNYPAENLSIPTIIVQKRGDGLVRVEYFTQNWKNTYGLVLYNSTLPSWESSQNITLSYVQYGPPSAVNPQIAPYPNGNLTISIGNSVVLRDYPIAWANLADFYIYGLNGSSFVSGILSITVYEVSYKY